MTRNRHGDDTQRAAEDAALDRLLGLMPTPAPIDLTLQSRLLAIPDGYGAAAGALGWRARIMARLSPRLLIGESAFLAASLIAGLWVGAVSVSADTATPDLSSLVLGSGSDLLEEIEP